jgi:hypothetical protein
MNKAGHQGFPHDPATNNPKCFFCHSANLTGIAHSLRQTFIKAMDNEFAMAREVATKT